MFDPLQGAPLSGQELCDAHAVPGSASPPGSSGIVGEKRQSEVSHYYCFCLRYSSSSILSGSFISSYCFSFTSTAVLKKSPERFGQQKLSCTQ